MHGCLLSGVVKVTWGDFFHCLERWLEKLKDVIVEQERMRTLGPANKDQSRDPATDKTPTYQCIIVMNGQSQNKWKQGRKDVASLRDVKITALSCALHISCVTYICGFIWLLNPCARGAQIREGSGYQNGWIFGKVPKGEGGHFYSKNLCCKIWTFEQGFFGIKMIQRGIFRVCFSII